MRNLYYVFNKTTNQFASLAPVSKKAEAIKSAKELHNAKGDSYDVYRLHMLSRTAYDSADVIFSI